MKEKIQELARKISGDLVRIRRHLHQHPELSFQEKKTSAYIESQLEGLNLNIQGGWAGYGMVVDLKGDKGDHGGVVALRADMDALPIVEKNQVEYASQNHGVMHACGHDVHSTVLIGALKILNEIKDELPGTVRGIFQPGEEKLPGGASIMIEEGLFDEVKPRAIFGLHVHPPLETGKVGVKEGLYMASADELYLTIRGKGGHAAVPQECVDPILIASEVIQALQKVVSRKAYPAIPSVLTIGKIQSEGGATNVIPNAVHLEGTFRTMDEDWRKEAHHLIREIAVGISRANGGDADVDVKVGYPYLKNDIDTTVEARSWMKEYLSDERVVDLPLRLSAEDFAYYTHHVPACFYRLGVRNEARGITSSVHQDTFDVDEDCLAVGAGMMAWLAYQKLTH